MKSSLGTVTRGGIGGQEVGEETNLICPARQGVRAGSAWGGHSCSVTELPKVEQKA